MAGRKRNTKALVQRIDRQYFRRWFALQRWRWILTTAAVASGLLWITVHAVLHDNSVYGAGPLTQAHAMLNRNCAACHVRAGAFASAITDRACSVCHDGAVHQASQTFTPQCVDCHKEHTSKRLTAVGDAQCTVCHGYRKLRTGNPAVAASIHSFSGDHPEFALLRRRAKDPAAIRFNHAIHMKADLRGANGNVTLICSDCHRAANTESWPYGETTVSASASAKYMDPVNYFEHCSKCHPLTFDRRFSEPAPHESPDAIRIFLAQKFSAWLAAHPEELRRSGSFAARIPGVPAPSRATTPAAWIAERVAEAEQLMRVKTCKECHEMTAAANGLPPIASTNITKRWFKHGEFDHSAHQMLVCDSCHQQARKSTRTSDVLLPGITVCRQCHIAGARDAAGSNCVECHVYHDPAKHKHVEGKFTSDQISTVH